MHKRCFPYSLLYNEFCIMHNTHNAKLFFVAKFFYHIFASEILNLKAMKVKLPNLTKEQITQLAQDPNAKVNVDDPWWVIALKVAAYLIGLILAGVGTATAATAMMF